MEQVSFKGRNLRKIKKITLNFGDTGFVTFKTVQFEYAYFFLIKKFLKYFFKFKYTVTNYFKI
jgi:hypothetical protein